MRIKEASTMEVVLRRIVLESTTIEVASNVEVALRKIVLASGIVAPMRIEVALRRN